MTFATVVNKSGLQARLYTSNFSLIEITFFLLVSCTLNIQVIQVLPIHKCNTQLFLLRGIHQNSFHYSSLKLSHHEQVKTLRVLNKEQGLDRILHSIFNKNRALIHFNVYKNSRLFPYT